MLRRQIAILTYFRFFSALRFGAVLLIIYFHRVSGSYALGMSIFSITSLSQLLFDIPTGVLSDRFGRKPIVVSGALTGLLFTVCYAIGLNYWFLALGALLEGLARALFSGNDAALLYETLAEVHLEELYPEYLGKISAAEPLAFALAALAGGFIATRSFHLAFWLTLLPQTIALCLTFFLREPLAVSRQGTRGSGYVRQALRQFGRNQKLRLLVTASALRYAFGESAFQFQPAFFQMLWPIWALGLQRTLTNAASALSFYFSGRVIARFEALKVLMAEVLIDRLLNTVALLFPSIVSPILMSLTAFTYGPAEVATGTLLQQEFTQEQRATMGSISSQAENLAFAIAAVGIGLVADRVGAVRALLLMQALLLGTLWLYRLIFRHDK
ncbi:MAG: MFS transporter [Dehalococcoidia bacterium]